MSKTKKEVNTLEEKSTKQSVKPPIEEFVENSTNNISKKIQKSDKHKSQKHNSTSTSITNKEESATTNSSINEVKDDSKTEDLEKQVLTEKNPKITKVVFQKSSCKVVEVQELDNEGAMTHYQYIEAEIDNCIYKRTIPNMFFYSHDGYLIGLVPTKDGFARIFLSDYPIIPICVMEDVSTSEEYLKFGIFRRNSWFVTIQPLEELYNKAVKLSKFGVKITSKYSSILSQYFSEFCMQSLPCKYVTSRLGWHNDEKDFVPYSSNIELLTNNPFSTKGTLKDWVNALSPFRKNTIFRIMLAAGFAGPLLKIVHERPFILYNWAPSRSGKTACLFASTSIYGNPKELVKSYNSTMVGLERALQFNTDVVFALDEKQIADNQKAIEKMAFMIANQEGRIRGTKRGGLDKTTFFTNLTISTGEEPFSQDNTTMGVASRVLEIQGSGFANEIEASSIYKIISNYYGTAGKEYISNLIKKYSNKNYKDLQEKLEEIKSNLEDKSTSDVRSYISSIAVIVLADILSSKWIFNEDDEEASIQMGVTILNQLKKANEMDSIDKIYDEVKEYIITNENYFAVYTKYVSAYKPEDDIYDKGSLCLGIKEGNVFYVFHNKLKEYLVRNNYSYLKVTQEFARRKYITPSYKSDGSIKTTTVQKKFKNVNLRFYAFPMDEILVRPGEQERLFPISMKADDFDELKKAGALYVRQS